MLNGYKSKCLQNLIVINAVFHEVWKITTVPLVLTSYHVSEEYGVGISVDWLPLRSVLCSFQRTDAGETTERVLFTTKCEFNCSIILDHCH